MLLHTLGGVPFPIKGFMSRDPALQNRPVSKRKEFWQEVVRHVVEMQRLAAEPGSCSQLQKTVNVTELRPCRVPRCCAAALGHAVGSRADGSCQSLADCALRPLSRQEMLQCLAPAGESQHRQVVFFGEQSLK